MKIRFYSEPILRAKCRPVKEVSPAVQKTLMDMAEAMYQAKGIGLAAPQVGIDAEMIVLDAGDGLISLVNPRIVKKEGVSIIEEGCLSLPGITIDVKRAKSVSVEGLNEHGQNVAIQAEGLKAHVLQHEIDHLKGILIIDYAGWRKRWPLRRKLNRISRALREDKKNREGRNGSNSG